MKSFFPVFFYVALFDQTSEEGFLGSYHFFFLLKAPSQRFLSIPAQQSMFICKSAGYKG